MRCSMLPSAARKQLETAEPGLFSFEEETLSGKHMAMVAGVGAFSKWYANSQYRFMHEVIHGDRFCRLYVDLDGTCEGSTSSAAVREVALRLHAVVQNQLVQYDMTAPTPCVMTGCYPGKFSSHLVWQLGFETPTHCRGFVEGVAAAPDCPHPMDLAVYKGRRAAGTFRMAYSRKRRTGVMMTPIDHPEFSVAAWAETLVTFHSGMDDTIGLLPKPPIVPMKLAIPTLPASLSFSEAEERRLALYRDKVLDWLLKSLPSVTVKSEDPVHLRTYCRSAERVHGSNGMYLSTRASGEVALYCNDSSCKCDVPMLFPSVQVLVSGIPLRINWSMVN